MGWFGFKCFGILDVQGREATNKAIKIINNELKTEVQIKQYATIEELMDALLSSGEINAIIVDKGFLDILDETEGHTEDKTKIREIYTVRVEETTKKSVKQTLSPNELYGEPFMLYISGIDCYGSVLKKSRSDVNIIATINPKTKQILLVSTPRDFFVPLSISNGIPDKLTHAGIYGIDVSKDTLGMLYDTQIDYYFRVNFDGFKAIINALGGVNVNSEYSFSTGGFSFTKGVNFLNGEQALAFARERYSFAGGDRQRGKNQMEVIKGVVEKLASPALLKNYKNTLNSLSESFGTNAPYDLISYLIRLQLDDNTSWNIVSYSANGVGDYDKPYSLSSNAYVMRPDMTTVEHAKELINQVKNGEVPTP